jgi:hypothetical protein
MINPSLQRAFFRGLRRFALLGRVLRPLSAWHLLQLHESESPMLGMGDGDISVGDLEVAAAICATQFPYRLESVPAGVVAFWRNRKAVRAAHRIEGFAQELLEWRAYYKAYGSQPLMFRSVKGKSCSCPTGLAIWAALFAHGFSESAAWNLPLDRASWYKVALAEFDGADIRIVTDQAAKLLTARGHHIEGYTP